jgi:predicted nucleic acid-binding protein
MALNLVLLDTCVFIKAFRGDKATATIIKDLEGQIAYSYITYLELLAGCKTNIRKKKLLAYLIHFMEYL